MLRNNKFNMTLGVHLFAWAMHVLYGAVQIRIHSSKVDIPIEPSHSFSLVRSIGVIEKYKKSAMTFFITIEKWRKKIQSAIPTCRIVDSSSYQATTDD